MPDRIVRNNQNRPYGVPGGINLPGSRGSYETFQPAERSKPQKQGLISRIVNAFRRAFITFTPEETTEQGASSAASPSTYQLTLLQERYERRELISDVRTIIRDEPRARRATLKFAREAVRDGVHLSINPDANKGVSQKTIKTTQEVLEKVQTIIGKKMESWAWMLHVEGDLFVQAIVRNDEVVNAKRMPAAAMERLTDDADEFMNPAEAFVQLDVMTNETIATFPLALMHHARWCHVDGDRYGQSELIAGRRIRKLLELEEEAQAVRRMTRATQRVLWNIGTAEIPAEPKVVEEFKEKNGFLEGTREIFDPNEIARDFFGTGQVSMQSLPADTGVSDVEDLKYQQNVYASSVLPTPPPIYNLDSESVNRDVLDDLRAEWLKETTALTRVLEEVVRFLVDLFLLLKGILPETVKYNVHFSESSIEKPSELVERVLNLRKNATGDFQPDPLVTRKKALELLADILDITDVDSELEALEKEREETQQKTLDYQKQAAEMQAEVQQQNASEEQPQASENGNAPDLSSLLQQAKPAGDDLGKTKFVTIDGKKVPITDGAVGLSHIQQAAQTFGIGKAGQTAMEGHHQVGKIKTDKDLYHHIAIAKKIQQVHGHDETSAHTHATFNYNNDLDFLKSKAENPQFKGMDKYHKAIYTPIHKETHGKEPVYQSAAREKEKPANVSSGFDPEETFAKQLDRKLSAEEEDAVDAWVTSGPEGYDAINKALRDEETPDARVEAHINALDKLFARPDTVISKSLKTHRSINAEPNSAVMHKYASLKPGDTFDDKGFVATSYDKAKNPSGNINLHISHPAGSKGLWVDGIVGENAESELLLPRGSKFTVDRVNHTKSSLDLHVKLQKK